MRDIEGFTFDMAKLAPDRYALFTRTSCSHLENEGIEWLENTKNYKGLRAYLHLLFGTDEHFTQLTGVVPPYGLPAVPNFERRIPRFLEGADIWREDLLNSNKSSGDAVALDPRADYVLVVTRDRMMPFLTPDQEVQVQISTNAKPGQMIVFNRREALEVAWCVDNDEYAFARGQGTFKIPSAGAVLGIVVTMQPFFAVPAARQSAPPKSVT